MNVLHIVIEAVGVSVLGVLSLFTITVWTDNVLNWWERRRELAAQAKRGEQPEQQARVEAGRSCT